MPNLHVRIFNVCVIPINLLAMSIILGANNIVTQNYGNIIHGVISSLHHTTLELQKDIWKFQTISMF